MMSLNYPFIIDLASQYLPPPGRLLDYGCGTAEVAALAIERGYDAYAVDTYLGVGDSPENLAVAAAKIGQRVLTIAPNARMPLANSFFDIVVANQVFEHVSELGHVCNEIARVMRSGGILFALMPTLEVFWEDHLKMPWVHRVPSGSKRQRILIRAFRRMGFGTARHLWDDEWVSSAVDDLQKNIFHRSVNEYLLVFAKHFRLIAEEEPNWARYRIKRHHLLKWTSPLFDLSFTEGLIRVAVRARAGAVLVLQRTDVSN
jgi:SAM-dependent methyltransferase